MTTPLSTTRTELLRGHVVGEFTVRESSFGRLIDWTLQDLRGDAASFASGTASSVQLAYAEACTATLAMRKAERA